MTISRTTAKPPRRLVLKALLLLSLPLSTATAQRAPPENQLTARLGEPVWTDSVTHPRFYQEKLLAIPDSAFQTPSRRPRWLIPVAGMVLGGAVGYALVKSDDDRCSGPGEDVVCLAVPGATLLGAFFGGLLGVLVESNLPRSDPG
ncbi:hypothetical protein BH23GEM4_BH23GEM4_18330 [soil metagenome]